MNWDVAHIIQIGVGVVIGGVITLWVNLFLQSRDRKKTYAIWNKEKIYDPLYNEVISKKNKSLAFFENPFDAATTLSSWDAFTPSERLRVPPDTVKVINKFDRKGRDYYEAYRVAEEVLLEHIGTVLSRARDDLQANFQACQRNIFDGYKGDFFAGRIFENKRHNFAPGQIPNLKDSRKLTFKTLFKEVSAAINGERAVVTLRERYKDLMEVTEQLERHLEVKIHFIMEKYESKIEQI